MRSPSDIRSENLVGSIDEIRQLGRVSEQNDLSVGSYIAIRGWLLDAAQSTPVHMLTVGIANQEPAQALLGIERADVAGVHGAQALRSGFLAVFPITAGPGMQSLVLAADVAGERYELVQADAFTTRSPDDPFAGLTLDALGWDVFIDGVFDGSTQAQQDEDGVVIVPGNVPTAIRGWALFNGLPAREIIARSGGRYLRVFSGKLRPDVAAFNDEPDAAACGFLIPVLATPTGVEEIRIFGVSEDDTYAHLTSVQIRQSTVRSSDLLPESAAIVGAVDGIAIDSIAQSADLVCTEDQELELRGWAIDEIGPLLVGGIEIALDDRTVVQTQTTAARADIAAKREASGITDCGFTVRWRVQDVAPGPHRLIVRALSARRDARATLAEIPFSIGPKR